MSELLFPEMQSAGSHSPLLTLRPYQRQAVVRVVTTLSDARACLVIAATGVGKTEIICSLIDTMDGLTDGALVISPLKDLTSQTAARLRSRGVPCGVEQGTNKSGATVTVACYNSLLSRGRYQKYLGVTKLVVVDEVHLNFSKRSLAMLQQFVESGAKLVGLTASPNRTKGDPLTSFYGPVAYEYHYRQAVDDGWLVPAKVWLTVIESLDLSAFKNAFGDFDPAKLAAIMQREKTVQGIAEMIYQHHDNQPSVVFAASIKQAELIQELLHRRGVLASIVHSNMEAEERSYNLYLFENGDNHIIINVGCLTLGWDCPNVRKLFIARPTSSSSTYIQMFGRGTRALSGTVDGLATPELRRAAIAASAKPYFEVYDITDTSRRNDLCTSLVVLRPDVDGDLMKRTRKQAERAPRTTEEVDAVVEEEKARMAAEQAALDALTADKRASLTARAKLRLYERDPHAPAEAVSKPKNYSYMPFGKRHRGKPLTQVPVDYLQWALREASLSKGLREAIEKEVGRRPR